MCTWELSAKEILNQWGVSQGKCFSGWRRTGTISSPVAEMRRDWGQRWYGRRGTFIPVYSPPIVHGTPFKGDPHSGIWFPLPPAFHYATVCHGKLGPEPERACQSVPSVLAEQDKGQGWSWALLLHDRLVQVPALQDTSWRTSGKAFNLLLFFFNPFIKCRCHNFFPLWRAFSNCRLVVVSTLYMYGLVQHKVIVVGFVVVCVETAVPS